MKASKSSIARGRDERRTRFSLARRVHKDDGYLGTGRTQASRHSTYLFVCHRGEIELKALLLAASLRSELGSGQEIVAMVPEFYGDPQIPGAQTREMLDELDVGITCVQNHLYEGSTRSNEGNMLINKCFCLKAPVRSERLIVLDSDILCLKDPGPGWARAGKEQLRAKPVDHQTERRWDAIYDVFGMEAPSARIPATVSGEPGPPYFNSGVIDVDAEAAPRLFEVWLDAFLRITESGIMNDNPFFREQVGLAVAVQKLKLTVGLLDEQANFPCHERPIGSGPLPIFAHYHWPSVIVREPVLLRRVRYLAERFSAVRDLMATHEDWLTFVFGE